MNVNTTNIGMSGSLYSNQLKSSDRTEKSVSGKAKNPMGLSNTQDSKALARDSSKISEESMDMFRRLQEESASDKQREEALFSKKGDIFRVSDGKGVEDVGDVTVSFVSNYSFLYRAAHDSVREYGDKISYINYNSLASAYDELRKGYATLYSGEKLEEKLSTLDADYEYLLDDLTESEESYIRAQASFTNGESLLEEAKKFNALSEQFANEDLIRKVRGLGVDKNSSSQSLMSSMDSIIDIAKSYIKQMGELARQYVLDGNTPSNTAKGRADFADYAKNNANPAEEQVLPTT